MTSAATTPFITIACGGTGGHLFPGLAVAEQLKKRGSAVALLISPKEVDQAAVKNAGDMEIITLPAIALQSGRRLAFLRGCWRSWRAARKLFRNRPPYAALAMGGFTSAPPILAAKGVGAKTFLHESNTIPGRANRWLARFVDQAFVGFPSAASRLHVRETTVTGTPVRSEFRGSEPHEPAPNETRVPQVAACRAEFGLDPDRPVVLVMGGSQGAAGINEIILSALPTLAKRAAHWQWLHLTGPKDLEKVQQAYAASGLKAVATPFLARMDMALGAATVAVSRAGASSLAELAAMRLPAVLVPFPHAADNHQFHNANTFAETGAALLLEQKNGTPENVASLLLELVEKNPVRQKMQTALARWDAPKAAAQIAEAILTSLAARVGAVSQSGTQNLNLRSSSFNKAPKSDRQIASTAGTFGAWALVFFGVWNLVVGSFLVV
jgi:UDP-N-acetylglucosamine--N-acetylmuramyl-(pentapeptide) pyrophosphoryl-undecaprenol N-acetylglucosamine transferase